MRDPKRSMCAAVLVLESVVLALSSIVLIVIEGLSTALGLGVGIGLAVVAVLAAGMLRSRTGYYLGSAVQVAAVALGVVAPAMLVLGLVFGMLWATAWWLGVKIERERAAYGASGPA